VIKAVTVRAMGAVAYGAVECIDYDVEQKKLVSIVFVGDGKVIRGNSETKEGLIVESSVCRTMTKATAEKLSVVIERREGEKLVPDKTIDLERQK